MKLLWKIKKKKIYASIVLEIFMHFQNNFVDIVFFVVKKYFVVESHINWLGYFSCLIQNLAPISYVVSAALPSTLLTCWKDYAEKLQMILIVIKERGKTAAVT